MKIIEDLGFKKQLLDKIAQREFYERTGTHGSDLIHCLNKQALRKLKPKEPTESEILIYSLGWASQRWLTGSFEPDEEYEVDGIKVTPDAVYPNYEACPWELKATYQSSNKAIIENLHWLRQIMAQCKVTGTTVAYLSRLEIMGDWKWVFKPKGFKDWSEADQKAFEKEHPHPTLSAVRLEFTQEEIDRNWDWMKERKVLFEAILETSILLPRVQALASGQDWECAFCPYHGVECR